MANNWTIDRYVMTRVYTDTTTDLTINLSDLFTEIEDMEEVQVSTVVNGIKQKIDDTIARSKDMKLTEAEKRVEQEALWNRISIEREWNMTKKASGPRETVSYAKLIPAVRDFKELGYDAEKTAGLLCLPLDIVERVYAEEKE